jgi:hypothetical protein
MAEAARRAPALPGFSECRGRSRRFFAFVQTRREGDHRARTDI